MRDIARLDEPTMYAIGFDRVTVKAFTQILAAVQTTLPEVVASAGDTAITLSGLQLIVTALQATVENIAANQLEGSPEDGFAHRGLAELDARESPFIALAAAMRVIAELQAEVQTAQLDYQKLSRRVADLENGVN